MKFYIRERQLENKVFFSLFSLFFGVFHEKFQAKAPHSDPLVQYHLIVRDLQQQAVMAVRAPVSQVPERDQEMANTEDK